MINIMYFGIVDDLCKYTQPSHEKRLGVKLREYNMKHSGLETVPSKWNQEILLNQISYQEWYVCLGKLIDFFLSNLYINHE